MIRCHTHQNQRHQQNIPGQCSYMERIQRIKIITTGDHRHTAQLAQKSNQEEKPGNNKYPYHGDD